MAKGSGTTKYVGSSQQSAANSTGVLPSSPVAMILRGQTSSNISSLALENKILNAGFSKTEKGYSYDDYDVSISLREYTAGNGQKYYRFDMSSDGQGSTGTYTKEEVSKFVSKSPSDLAKAVKSYIEDSFNPKKAQTQADLDMLKKKYFDI